MMGEMESEGVTLVLADILNPGSLSTKVRGNYHLRCHPLANPLRIKLGTKK